MWKEFDDQWQQVLVNQGCCVERRSLGQNCHSMEFMRIPDNAQHSRRGDDGPIRHFRRFFITCCRCPGTNRIMGEPSLVPGDKIALIVERVRSQLWKQLQAHRQTNLPQFTFSLWPFRIGNHRFSFRNCNVKSLEISPDNFGMIRSKGMWRLLLFTGYPKSVRAGGMNVLRPSSYGMLSEFSPRISSSLAKHDEPSRSSTDEFLAESCKGMNEMIARLQNERNQHFLNQHRRTWECVR
jgi:hypothetical protein